MFKFSGLVLGLLTVIALAPQSQSIAASVDPLAAQNSLVNIPTQPSGVKSAANEQGKKLAQRRILQADPGEESPEEPAEEPPSEPPAKQPPEEEQQETHRRRRHHRCGGHHRHHRHHRHHDHHRHDDGDGERRERRESRY
jgi:hypothetical protein